jgi:hypothetical protein
MADEQRAKELPPRRLVDFKDGCRYGKFGRTKAYELIAQKADCSLQDGSQDHDRSRQRGPVSQLIAKARTEIRLSHVMRRNAMTLPLRSSSSRSAQCCIICTRSRQ